ncbi:winged helix-turn-helix transcriptional regulator [Pedobacter sp. N36a]|uniref:MarR family winged helix-turn-helix transcriptional regulator n=1 Tax=Pedobacter sp. N36a TaxID=2767996 RepID=UPI001656AE5F|nr:MarR family winged helix-turn-helix transcriptional regulator [Pedobacter sp. N36a]MBC8988079.1 winged helix-turn-helix transcriptional regulator [Pedobacter sp. N36a]
MNYQLIKQVIDLIEKFDTTVDFKSYPKDLTGFKRWIQDDERETEQLFSELDWEGKENGRSPESEISTLIVHLNRYAKTYSKSAIHNSKFNTQEEFIYLIHLKTFGSTTKTELIKKNLQEKPVGMQIINRLIGQGWIQQNDSMADKRSKIISITGKGLEALDDIMEKIRQASQIVTGNLSPTEKMHLIKILQKLDRFHLAIYTKNIAPAQLVNVAYNEFLLSK